MAVLRGEAPVTEEFLERAEEVLGVPKALFGEESVGVGGERRTVGDSFGEGSDGMQG